MVKKKKAKARAKAVPRKTVKKKTKKKKTLKKHAGKKASKKKAAKKTGKKTAARKQVRKAISKKAATARKPAPEKESAKLISVKPGPPAGSVPPVEEPTRQEEAVGIVTHYYSHLGVAVVQMNKGSLRIGDTIHIKGHSTDFLQKVESLEFEHGPVDQASAGQNVGLKVVDHAREHDIVYMVK